MKIILLLNFLFTIARGEKLFNLQTLVMLPITGDEPRSGQACKAAVDVVINEVNQRMDILPEYSIKPIYRDETGPAGNMMPAIINQFRRQQGSEEEGQNPVIIGGWYSPGCISVGSHLHHIDMVQVAMGCSTPVLTARRRRFPNTFRMRGTGELTAFPFLRFINDIGRWNRFGIITNAGNSFDYTLAISLMNAAQSNAFEVAYFDSVPEVSDLTIEALKQSDTRIIVVMSSVAPFVLRFMCQAYKFGITGERYFFLVLIPGFVEPTSLPDVVFPNCTGKDIFQQFQQSIWIGWASNPFNRSSTSSLGMSFDQFESQLFNLTGRSSIPADFDKRSICHDSALSAVLSLDLADRKLAKLNMSLRDYATHSTLVAKIVNDTVASNEFNGFRIGKVKYSQRAELDDETFVAVQWTPVTRLRTLTTFRQHPFTSAYRLPSYYIAQRLNDPIWNTPLQGPPKDRSISKVDVHGIPDFYFWLTVAAATLFSPIQIYGLWFSSRDREWPNGYPHCRLFLTLGSILLNASAIAFNFTSQCYLQRILPAFALSLISCSITSRLVFHINMKTKYFPPSKTFRRLTMNQLKHAISDELKHYILKAKKRYVILFNCLGFLITIAYLIAWLLFSNPIEITVVSSKSGYNQETDTFRTIKSNLCRSGDDFVWALILAAVHISTLCFSAIIAKRLKYSTFQQHLFADLNPLRLATTNVATLAIGAVLITAVLSSYPVEQMIVQSIFCILISLVLNATIYWPLLRSNFNRDRSDNIAQATIAYSSHSQRIISSGRRKELAVRS